MAAATWAAAALLGGAAGGFVGPDMLEARLTFEDAKEGGYTLGSGVIMVFDESADLVDLCLRIARFFRDESCGQCVPCRVGTVRQEEALHRLVLVKETLGDDWLTPDRFRIGASSLLNDLLMQYEHGTTGRYQRPEDFSKE